MVLECAHTFTPCSNVDASSFVLVTLPSWMVGTASFLIRAVGKAPHITLWASSSSESSIEKTIAFGGRAHLGFGSKVDMLAGRLYWRGLI